MKVVSPYRPFAPESIEHRVLGPFDWVDALRMLAESVRASNGCDTFAITDVDTDLGVPAYQYQTTDRRLMVWMLDVALRYLESDDFDQDTVMVCPDTLVFGDLRPYFGPDLGVIVRLHYKYAKRPIINSVQWWSVDGKRRLIAFYRRALEIARALPESMLVWGADSEPIRQMLTPLQDGESRRSGLDVRMHDMASVMQSLNQITMDALDNGWRVGRPSVPLLDFRYTRKHYMRPYFDAMAKVAA